MSLLAILPSLAAEKVVELDQVVAVTGLPALKATHKRDAVLQNLVLHQHLDGLPKAGSTYAAMVNEYPWQVGKVGALTEQLTVKGQLAILKAQLEVDRFTKGTFEISWPGKLSLFLNGMAVSGKEKDGTHSFDVSLINASHQLVFIFEAAEESTVAAIKLNVTNEKAQVSFDVDPMRRAWMEDFYYLDTPMAVAISPNGQYVGTSIRRYDQVKKAWEQRFAIVERATQKQLYRWLGETPGNLTFTPSGDAFVYSMGGKIWHQALDGSAARVLLEDASDVGSFNFAHAGNVLVFEWNHSETPRTDGVKRYRGLEDRWSYWGRRAQVFQLDLRSGFVQQMTDLTYGASISDVADDKVLLTTTLPEYDQPPYSPTVLYTLDLKSGELEKVLRAQFLQGALFAPKGLYLMAGPNAFDGLGNTEEEPGNEYDAQLFHYNLQNKKLEPLSKAFNPSLLSMNTLPDGDLLLYAIDYDKQRLFTYDASEKSFNLLNSGVDTVDRLALSSGERPVIAFSGSNVSQPEAFYTMDLGAGEAKLLAAPGKAYFDDVRFGDVREFMVKTDHGREVPGRIYLPADFDASKKYPTIVYYYGGVVPVGTDFTGRYPFHLWAAQGYAVYVVQPSGTVGWGQAKSAKHVNAWGRDTADDIIDATRAYLAEHSFADTKRVGCMGASYGGFMTMYLTTRTDLFSAAVAHAGISDLTGYWGFGWWGYMYSGIATRDSFPWNAKELYTEQSPVFSADKVKTPLLLVTGDSDTNVPASQSHTMYTALKLLGKDVDLVEVEGQDHHINDPAKRMIWWNTISSYFDRHLKQQPEWWESIYPE